MGFRRETVEKSDLKNKTFRAVKAFRAVARGGIFFFSFATNRRDGADLGKRYVNIVTRLSRAAFFSQVLSLLRRPTRVVHTFRHKSSLTSPFLTGKKKKKCNAGTVEQNAYFRFSPAFECRKTPDEEKKPISHRRRSGAVSHVARLAPGS